MQRVTAAIIEKDGAFLIARRKKDGWFGGLWEFPGGKIEPRESPEECLQRELREELGAETAVSAFMGGFVYSAPFLEIELLAYKASVLSGEFILHDHDEVRWVRPEEFTGYAFAEPDLPLVKLLLAEETD